MPASHEASSGNSEDGRKGDHGEDHRTDERGGEVSSAQKEENTAKLVSFHKEIRPLLQSRCAGCHQPAKAKGDYVMTDFIS